MEHQSWQAGFHEAGGSPKSCTALSHCLAPGKAIQEPLSSLHEGFMPHPCSNLMGKGLEIRNLPEISNSSQPLLLLEVLLHALFSGEKWLRIPFVSCFCCPTTHNISTSPRAFLEVSPGTQAKGCQVRVHGPAPHDGMAPRRVQQWEQTRLSKRPRNIPRGKRKHEKSSFFNRERKYPAIS